MFKQRQTMIIKPLSDLHQGETGKIVSILGKPMMHRYFYKNRLTVGCNVTVLKVQTMPIESWVTLKTGDRILTLAKYLAHNIRVEVPLDIMVKERQLVSLKKELVQA